jgi:hypothetical protein
MKDQCGVVNSLELEFEFELSNYTAYSVFCGVATISEWPEKCNEVKNESLAV